MQAPRSNRTTIADDIEGVDPEGAADEITKEYIEVTVTVADALDDLRSPGAGDFFGRIDDWTPPTWHRMVPRAQVSGNQDLAARVAEVAVATKHRRRVSGVVAPVRLHPVIVETLGHRGLVAVDHVHELDGVIVVNPHEILSEGTESNAATGRGARLLDVAMTRAVQELHFVTDTRPPSVLDIEQ